MRTCSGCGKEIESNLKLEFMYCEKCERERNDLSVMPLVWQYTGGVLGSIPNARSVDYFLDRHSFEYKMTHKGVRIFVSDSCYCNIAIELNGGFIVLVNGKFEFDSLASHPSNFFSQPDVKRLPKSIESLNPEFHKSVMNAKRRAGIAD